MLYLFNSILFNSILLKERREVERKLLVFVDEKYGILRNELNKEAKNRNESIENFTFYLEVNNNLI